MGVGRSEEKQANAFSRNGSMAFVFAAASPARPPFSVWPRFEQKVMCVGHSGNHCVGGCLLGLGVDFPNRLSRKKGAAAVG